MEKIRLFLGGAVAGALIVYLFFYIYNTPKPEYVEDDRTEEVVDEPEEETGTDAATREIINNILNKTKIIDEKSFKVISVMHSHAALVCGKTEYGNYNGTVYLLVEDNNSLNDITPFYDDQIINVPKNTEVQMYDTYRYTTYNGQFKTVPKIRIAYKYKE